MLCLTNQKIASATFFTGDVKKKWKSSLRQQQICNTLHNSNHYNLETAFPDEFTDHYMYEVSIAEI